MSFGAFVAGNTAAGLLAELGADVVKIEARSRPEFLRNGSYAYRHTYVEPSGVTNTMTLAGIARSARNLALDLATAEGREVFHRLVARADVVVENFAGSTLAKWGCAYEDLLADNPRLVMLSLSGYGHSGPRAGYLAYAASICGFIGLTDAWRYSHGTHSDWITGATGVLGTIAAVARARRTGEPTHLDVAQIDAMVGLMAPMLLDPLANGRTGGLDQPEPNRVPGSRFSGVFPAKGHDEWLAIELEDDDDWDVMRQVIDRADLGPGAGTAEIDVAVSEWVKARTAQSGMHLLQQEGLAVAAVQQSEDVWRDPQLRERGFAIRMDHPDIGLNTYAQSVYHRMAKTPGRMRRTMARLGEHTDEVLRQWLALDDESLQQLSDCDAIFDLERDLRVR